MNKKAIFTVTVLGTISFYTFYISDEPMGKRKDTMALSSFGSDNEPVHMPGCKTFHGPVAPKVIYPTVTQNFIARLCALEVPPSSEAIALQRNSGIQKTAAVY